MTPVIYADTLFLYNFFVNSIIFAITAKCINSKISLLKIALGAGIGGIYSVLMFFPAVKIFYTFILKIAVLFGTFCLVFPERSIHKILKGFAVFLTVNFALGGGIYSLVFLTDFGVAVRAVVSGAEVYMDLSLITILSGIALTYAALALYGKSRQRAEYERSLIKRVKIVYKGKIAEVNMFLDTGCRLCDAVNDRPAIIVSLRYIKMLLDEEECKIIEKNALPEEVYAHGLRVLPLTTVNGQSVITGIVADYVCIDDVRIKKVTVGLLNEEINENYCGIINPEILNEGDDVL